MFMSRVVLCNVYVTCYIMQCLRNALCGAIFISRVQLCHAYVTCCIVQCLRNAQFLCHVLYYAMFMRQTSKRTAHRLQYCNAHEPQYCIAFGPRYEVLHFGHSTKNCTVRTVRRTCTWATILYEGLHIGHNTVPYI